MTELKPIGKFLGFQWRGGEHSNDVTNLIQAGVAKIEYINYGGSVFQELYVKGMHVNIGDWVVMFPNGGIRILTDGEVSEVFIKKPQFTMERGNDNIRPNKR